MGSVFFLVASHSICLYLCAFFVEAVNLFFQIRACYISLLYFYYYMLYITVRLKFYTHMLQIYSYSYTVLMCEYVLLSLTLTLYLIRSRCKSCSLFNVCANLYIDFYLFIYYTRNSEHFLCVASLAISTIRTVSYRSIEYFHYAIRRRSISNHSKCMHTNAIDSD